MRVVIAGGHGQVARRLTRALAAQGHGVVGIVRNADHVPDLEDDGARPVVLDLEQTSARDLAEVLVGAEAVVFAAGAGPGSGDARKQTVDLGAAVLLAEAAELAAVRRYLLVSSRGVERVRDGATPAGTDPAFAVYLRAKLAAEEDVRRRGLDWLVVRPGRLTDDPGTGRVRLDDVTDAAPYVGSDVGSDDVTASVTASVPASVPGSAPAPSRDDVPRDDVAAVLAALLDRLRRDPSSGRRVLELVAGDDPVAEAVDRVSAGRASS